MEVERKHLAEALEERAVVHHRSGREREEAGGELGIARRRVGQRDLHVVEDRRGGYEDQRLDAVGVAERVLHRDVRAVGVAQDRGALEAQRLAQRIGVVRPRLVRHPGPVVRLGRAPVAEVIVEHQRPIARERIEPRAEERVVEAHTPVHEQQGRTRSEGLDVKVGDR